MKKYMLDTNACIHVMSGRVPQVRERLAATRPEQIALSAIVVAELHFGVSGSSKQQQERNHVALQSFLRNVEILDWPAEAGQLYGEVRAQSRRLGQPIGANDLLIGYHALWLQRILVTQNVREFQRIEELQLDNWADPALPSSPSFGCPDQVP